jgi:hypothetical protein
MARTRKITDINKILYPKKKSLLQKAKEGVKKAKFALQDKFKGMNPIRRIGMKKRLQEIGMATVKPVANKATKPKQAPRAVRLAAIDTVKKLQATVPQTPVSAKPPVPPKTPVSSKPPVPPKATSKPIIPAKKPTPPFPTKSAPPVPPRKPSLPPVMTPQRVSIPDLKSPTRPPPPPPKTNMKPPPVPAKRMKL